LQALENFTKAIELLQSWAGHYVWRAAIYYEYREIDKTLHDLDKAVELRPDEVSLFWRGLLYLDTGENFKALYDLQAAYKEATRPVHSRIVFWLGAAQYLTGNKEEAKKCWGQTRQLAKDERKVAQHSEPARVALILDNDQQSAKKFYDAFFKSFYTIDNAKTENAHLELLLRLFPENTAIQETLRWFERCRKRIYRFSNSNQFSKTQEKALEMNDR